MFFQFAWNTAVDEKSIKFHQHLQARVLFPGDEVSPFARDAAGSNDLFQSFNLAYAWDDSKKSCRLQLLYRGRVQWRTPRPGKNQPRPFFLDQRVISFQHGQMVFDLLPRFLALIP